MLMFVVAALKTRTILLVIQGFQSRETSSIPGACVPLLPKISPPINGFHPA